MAKAAPLNKTVPITAFNRGKAGQIFSEVKRSGMAVVIKNNAPECVLLSPQKYEEMREELHEMQLARLAAERLRDFDAKKCIPFEEVCKNMGMSPAACEDGDEVVFE